jgi:hypothetical protein
MDPATTNAHVLSLIRASLALWEVPATVRAVADGAWLIVVDDGRSIYVQRASAGIPFRWMVEGSGRERPASSVAGLLRVLRAMLDPEWRPARARIVGLSLPYGADKP